MSEIRLDKRLAREKLDKLVESFKGVLYEKDAEYLRIMKKNNLAGDDLGRYQFWEWTQGVGLYGLWKLFENTKRESYLEVLEEYYASQLAGGLPAKNVNTCAPLLTLSCLYEYTRRDSYLEVCAEWAEWVMEKLPRTEEGGFQHITSDRRNDQELWDDTLFMTVLFLANMGRILNRRDYMEEAEYQFLIHTKYLTDRKTGLWFHGWTFNGNHNFAGALWGRGNCWVTMAIPIFLEMTSPEGGVKRFLTEALKAQARSLEKYQDESGMWRTLIDDETSYPEASATSGFGYGILKAVRAGLIDPGYEACAMRALKPVLDCVNEAGILEQVSYGTPMGRESKDFYKQIPIRHMPYGQAIAMLFLSEALKGE